MDQVYKYLFSHLSSQIKTHLTLIIVIYFIGDAKCRYSLKQCLNDGWIKKIWMF
jgi:hypothetical protein